MTPRMESSKSGKARTPIKHHKRVGKRLFPPFSPEYIGKDLRLSSWIDKRLPEMLWAVLIMSSAANRNYALAQFRRILDFIYNHEQKDQFYDLTLTGIANLEKELRSELIDFIVEPIETSRALCTLRLFDTLPGLKNWDKALPSFDPSVELLMDAIGRTLGHQSQESTDCRWLKIMVSLMSGKLMMSSDTGDLIEELLGYPNVGDQGAVQSSIRALEIGMPIEQDTAWSKSFWEESWQKTDCIMTERDDNHHLIEEGVTRDKISCLCDHLNDHWQETHLTTAIDAKHDAVFGMAFYSIRILEEMMGIAIGTSVIARLGLRTILETLINLKYLFTKDDDDLWDNWRKYGVGQAKLNALRFNDTEPPKFIDIESIEQITNEDMWEEFVDVNLAGWSGLDLRKLSEKSNMKDTYDKYYSWTSGYSHGMWGAIRESCYQTCENPLHRLHRCPERQSLKDAVDDAAIFVDEIMELVHKAYPTFEWRLLNKDLPR